MPQGAMLKFARRADNCALAVAFDEFWISAQAGYQRTCHFEAKRLEIIHESGNLRHVGTCERIANDSQYGGAAQRYRHTRTSLMKDFLDCREQLSNPDLRHVRDSRIRSFLTRKLVPGPTLHRRCECPLGDAAPPSK